MQGDVLVDFHLLSVKLQALEYALLSPRLSKDQLISINQDAEQSRRDLGVVLFQLLSAAVPSRQRNGRLFRAKYTEEVDVVNLERCLIAAANKVVNYSPSSALHDRDLRPAQPAANRFLDLLSQVQCIVLNIFELALANCDKNHSNQPEVPDNPEDIGSDITTTEPETSTGKSAEQSQDMCSSPSSVLPIKHHEAATQRLTQQFTGARSVKTVVVKLSSLLPAEFVRLPPVKVLSLTDELCNILIDLDDSAASFEFEFVRTLSRRLRTLKQGNDLQLIAVLFSETLMWGLAVRLLTVQQLADRDPSVLLSLPRLAIFVGTRLLPGSLIGTERLTTGRRLPFMFSSSRADLAYLSRQLNALRIDQLARLARWLGPRGLPNLIVLMDGEQNKKINRTLPATTPRLSASPTSRPSEIPRVAPTIISSSTATSGSDKSIIPRMAATPTYGRRHYPWKVNLLGLHRIYKRMSAVADRVASRYPTELRYILKIVIEMHDTSSVEAAIAQLKDDCPDTSAALQGTDDDCFEEEEAEEAEFELDAHQALSDKHFTSLARLLDWNKVAAPFGAPLSTTKNENLDASVNSMLTGTPDSVYSSNLTKVLQSSFMAAASTSSDNISGLVDVGSTETVSPVAPSDQSVIDQQLEVGIDVAAMCPEYLSEHDVDQDTTPKSTAPGYTTSAGTKSFLGPLTRLIASSIKIRRGSQSHIDRGLHYLPAWQPDNPGQVDRFYLTGIAGDFLPDVEQDQSDEAEDEEESETLDDLDDSDFDIRKHRAVPYIVGKQCAACLRHFTLIRRRHHCRRCGHIFCSSCSNYWQSVEGLLSNKPERICTECHQFLNPDTQ